VIAVWLGTAIVALVGLMPPWYPTSTVSVAKTHRISYPFIYSSTASLESEGVARGNPVLSNLI
jgi:hypothetical protein